MKITFNSWLKTTLGCDEEEIELPSSVVTISDLAELLGERHKSASTIFEIPEALRYVVDRRYVTADHRIADVDAVEIYPPVTGG